ncbi:MAG TPA: DUF664 domain-containing protein [Jatrophihabitans sp.]|jgi:hypothetical protein
MGAGVPSVGRSARRGRSWSGGRRHTAKVERLRAEGRAADEAVTDIDFDDTVEVPGERFSLRMIYVHMIGEYARHNGHADLLREAIDGVTGR